MTSVPSAAASAVRPHWSVRTLRFLWRQVQFFFRFLGRQLDLDIVLPRVAAGEVIVFATYNVFGYSYIDWVLATQWGEIGMTGVIWRIIPGILLFMAIYYFASKVRHKLRLIGALLFIALLGLISWLLILYEVLPATAPVIITMAEIGLGVIFGVGMSAPIIDRRMSGTGLVDLAVHDTDQGQHDGDTGHSH